MNRMVTNGYRKGVYDWVTKGTGGGDVQGERVEEAGNPL